MINFLKIFWHFLKNKIIYFIVAAVGLYAVLVLKDWWDGRAYLDPNFYRNELMKLLLSKIPFFLAPSFAMAFSWLIIFKQEKSWNDKKVRQSYLDNEVSFASFLWGNVLSSLVYIFFLQLILVGYPKIRPSVFWIPLKIQSFGFPMVNLNKPLTYVPNLILASLWVIVLGLLIHLVGWKFKKYNRWDLKPLINMLYYLVFAFFGVITVVSALQLPIAIMLLLIDKFAVTVLVSIAVLPVLPLLSRFLKQYLDDGKIN